MSKREIFLCSPKKVEGVNSLPMIQFELIKDTINYQGCDTLLFTSKQAVYFTNELDNNWINYPTIAIGNATKELLLSFGANVIYTPKNFYGKELADDILKYFKERKLLYIRPLKISFDSKSYLESRGVYIKEEIIYKTNCIEYENRVLPKDSIIIFTSPSTIDCFFKSFKWDSSYTAVVIGKSTLSKLPSGIKLVVSSIATINSCIECAKNL